MDPNAARFQHYDRRVEIWWDGDARYYRGTVKNYHRSTKKYGILYDDDSWEVLDLHRVAHRWLKPEAPLLPAPPELGTQGHTAYLREVDSLVVETVKRQDQQQPLGLNVVLNHATEAPPSFIEYHDDEAPATWHYDDDDDGVHAKRPKRPKLEPATTTPF